MKILAIETSCDETAVAVVEDGRKVLSNSIASQIDLHAKTGGVVPEVAAREHVLKILPVIDQSLEEAQTDWEEIDALAVTKGPGLISSLIIGTETASVISYVKNLPLIEVQHITGHVYSNWLLENSHKNGQAQDESEPEFPILILTVSGGHNELILMKDHGDFEVLGETRDDAAGEAFDKVARILEMGYPGGPAIAKAAEKGDRRAFDLPRSYLEKDSLDFSFSGLKTAVLNEVMAEREKSQQELSDEFKNNLAASFQEAVTEVLSDKLIRAYEKHPQVKELHLAGGVSANLRLRELISQKLPEDVKFRFPKSIRYCTDNAAMIAAAAYYLHKDSDLKVRNVVPEASFEIY